MNWGSLISYSITIGLGLSTVMAVLIIISLLINREMWLQDYPPDVKKAWGPMSDIARRQRAVFALIFFGAIIGVMVFAVVRLADVLGAPPSFLAVFACAAIIFAIFNVVDAIVIDWLILMVLWPGLAILPGTEGLPGYRDMRLWTANFAKGFVAAILVGLLTGGVTSLLYWASAHLS